MLARLLLDEVLTLLFLHHGTENARRRRESGRFCEPGMGSKPAKSRYFHNAGALEKRLIRANMRARRGDVAHGRIHVR